jgi:hypothetical protein
MSDLAQCVVVVELNGRKAEVTFGGTNADLTFAFADIAKHCLDTLERQQLGAEAGVGTFTLADVAPIEWTVAGSKSGRLAEGSQRPSKRSKSSTSKPRVKSKTRVAPSRRRNANAS